ncbi:YbaK/prolyl-tRNA synthetase associated region [Cellulomonas flavigena DSM 20109]|uniref:YbaK/prolyl-tRNA synthetase associated region n=1 Tax=Cellulomonas flavigena (strain ATCC 482 / DSM 20109 / BCRC 11376 / JCM 18109 / NBRC 3775 / NCIMB 8073 / NRS 134) TaxID=446466 RepID=D5UFE2_CELFN|nr:YbaK/EbsC family protein [Cellulomonas flavigena]ADG74939.1 YbaK/prolyl-tRNA synthetase associated region [Cellulomonas flavigena DSM 20109]
MITTHGTLTWERAVDRPDLLAASTHAVISGWAVVEPAVADAVLVAAIDPDLADTAAMTDAYELPLSASVNCVLVAGKRAGEERTAACLVRATTRADVNNAVKRLLDVRKASFLPMDRATDESRMEYGGITPLGLPVGYRVLADAGVAVDDPEAGGTVIIGSGTRRSKIALPGALLVRAPGVEVVEGLAIG